VETYSLTVVIEPDEDQSRAYALSLPGCHPFGAAIVEARQNIAEAIRLHLDCVAEDKVPVRQELVIDNQP
jgi:predicted RNase H-like HicB family nuclease